MLDITYPKKYIEYDNMKNERSRTKDFLKEHENMFKTNLIVPSLSRFCCLKTMLLPSSMHTPYSSYIHICLPDTANLKTVSDKYKKKENVSNEILSLSHSICYSKLILDFDNANSTPSSNAYFEPIMSIVHILH